MRHGGPTLLPVEPSADAEAAPSPDRLDRHPGRRVRKRNAYLSTASATGRPRFVAREIAALEFLGSIAMCAEPRIVARHRALVDDGAGFGRAPADDGDGAEGAAALAMPEHDAAPGEAGDRAGGRRLPGREAAVVRVPRAFRHSLLRVPPGAAVVRQWERRAHGEAAGKRQWRQLELQVRIALEVIPSLPAASRLPARLAALPP